MAIPKIVGAQRDFSSGELDVSMKRADESPVMKTGARQLSNVRVLSSGIVKNRPGRRALFLETGRVDEVLMAPGQIFYVAFGNGYLRVYNAAGTQVFSSTKKGDGSTNIPWTSATVKNIVFAVASGSAKAIYITYGDDAPLNVPQVLTWDGVSQSSTWTLTTYAETVTAAAQKRTLFYRISPQNITMQPSATTGVVTITFSASVLVSGMIGTRMRYCQKQIQIKTVSSGTSGTAIVLEPLPIAQQLATTGSVGYFNIGDLITGATSGANGIVTGSPNQQSLTTNGSATPNFQVGDTLTGSTSGATGVITAIFLTDFITVTLNSSTAFQVGETVTDSPGGGTQTLGAVSAVTLTVQLIPQASGNIAQFTTTEKIAGPNGSATNTGVTTTTPQAVGVWDDEVMNLFRGYPTATFFDQNRLGFNNFPSIPSGQAWSGISLPNDFYVAALGDNAIFELAPGKSQVLFVIPGMESSEFVFCDNAIYYIPITASIPLVPGSVAFNLLSEQGCAPNVKPQLAQQSILYVKAGTVKIAAVQAPGAYYRPYIVDEVSEFHSHLFTASAPIAIAVPSATNQFEEMYAYILLGNGSIVNGKYAIRNGLLDIGQEGKPKIGWLPWTGAGTSTWISAQGADTIFTTAYGSVSVVEVLDNTQYLDGALSVNNLPAPFTPPGGKGPLYVFPGPNTTVSLMDQSTRMMGTYSVDANGNIIPQGNAGENLSIASLMAGQPWTAISEPFTPMMQPGQDVGQRMKKRRASRFGVYVSNSTGFLFARLFSGPLTPTSPALGTIMNTRRVTAWNQDDDPTKPPPLRESGYFWRPLGRAYDPRYAIIKDTPGPLDIHETGWETTV